MISVILFLLTTAFAMVLLALPFLKKDRAPDRRSYDLSVYQDQLVELERDLERGVIDAEASRAAKVEIERRILALAGDDGSLTAVSSPAKGGIGLISAVSLLVLVPVTSALLYMQLGRPNMPDVPLASRILPQQELSGQSTVLANIQQIQERLEDSPEDRSLWILLARTQLEASLYSDAAGSFGKALSSGTDDPILRSERGEAMVYAADGMVTPSAMQEFEAALTKAPNEPRARYYIGMALAQEGKIDDALGSWRDLLEVSPADAPWRPQIITAIRSMLQNAGRPFEDVVANLPEGTEGQGGDAEGASSIVSQSAAIQPLPPEQQNDEIKSMVEGLAARLEAEPDNLDGWVMLGRSRMVLGEPEAAKEALQRALDMAPDNPEVISAYAAILLEPGTTPDSDPLVGIEAAGLYKKAAALAPDNPEPRWLLGLAAAQAGNKKEAVGHWQAFLDLVDEASQDHAFVTERLQALEGGESLASAGADKPSSTVTKMEPAPAKTTPAQDTVGSLDSSGPQPTAEDMAEMAALSTDERTDRIRTMVDGLAARLEDDPSDVDGWLRLAQSRKVLGEPEAANEAYRRALEADPENPKVLRALASSLLGEIHPETKVAAVGEEAAALYQDLIKIEPDDPEAHWYLGLAAIQEGDADVAKSHWKRVLDVLGPDHPNYAAVQSSLEKVETKTQ